MFSKVGKSHNMSGIFLQNKKRIDSMVIVCIAPYYNTVSKIMWQQISREFYFDNLFVNQLITFLKCNLKLTLTVFMKAILALDLANICVCCYSMTFKM